MSEWSSDTMGLRLGVTYSRVSDKSQIKRGDGLGSQRTRCHEFAKFRGIKIIDDFDDDFTGKSVKRPGLNALLTFLRKHRHENIIVLIDDISRLARHVESHWELRRLITEAGGELRSPSMEFKDDADGRMFENTMAGAAQYHREKNAEQTYNRSLGYSMVIGRFQNPLVLSMKNSKVKPVS